MADTKPQANPETPNGAESETAARTREVHVALNSITSSVNKWLAVTVMATTRETFQTSWPVAQTIGRAFGVDETEFARNGDGKTIKEYCEKTFTTSGIVESQTAPGYQGKLTTSFRLTSGVGMMAAAVAGVLFKSQLEHPDIDLPYIFGGNAERRDLGDMVRLRVLSQIASRSIDDYVPASFIWAVGTPHDYKAIDTLVDIGALDRVTKENRKMRSFVISKPQSYSPSAVAPERLMIYQASMALLESGETRVTGEQLMNRILAMFPEADEKAVWKNLTGKHPVFLKSELHPALRRPYDKVAVRINVRYREMLVQLMDDLAGLAEDEANREAARKYAQDVIGSSAAMGVLWELFYNPVYEGASVPAPTYPGWQTHLHQSERWRPTLPPYRPPQIDMAEVALRADGLQPSGRQVLTNKQISEALERSAKRRKQQGA